MLIDLSVVHRSDFQTNEKKIMGELDDLAKSAGAKKRKGDMNSAVEGTEEIRAWVSNTIKNHQTRLKISSQWANLWE